MVEDGLDVRTRGDDALLQTSAVVADLSGVVTDAISADRSGLAASRSRWWVVGGVALLVGLLGAILYSERANLSQAGTTLVRASPWWTIAVVCFALASLGSLVLVHTAAQRAAGLDVGPAALVRPTVTAQMLNLVTKSNGLAGLIAFRRHAYAHNQSRGAVVAAYLLAGIAQQIGFAVVALVAFVLLVLDGGFHTVDLVASAAFVGYVGLNAAIIGASVRSRDATRRLHAIPRRIVARLAHKPSAPIDSRAADDFFDAAQLIVRKPRAMFCTVIPAVGVDLMLAVALWLALHAVGSEASFRVALVAFGVSTLFGIVSFLPSGLGFVEVSSVAVLVSAGVPVAQAGAAVALYRLAELWLPVTLGIILSASARPSHRYPFLRPTVALGSAIGGVNTLFALAAVHDGPQHRFEDAARGVLSTGRYFAVVCAVALCSLAPALWRGKRWAAETFVVVAGLVVVLVPTPHRTSVAIPLAAAALVVAFGRASFTVRSDGARVRNALRAFTIRQGAILVYGVAGLYLLDRDFRSSASLGESIVQAVRLLFVLPPSTIAPATAHGALFVESVRLVSLTSLVVLIAVTLIPLVTDRSHEWLPDARRVIESFGDNGLAPFALDDDKNFAIGRDGDGVVAYHLAGSVALALGGPVGSPEGRESALDEFLARCERCGWTPGFHQVSDGDRALLEQRGFHLQHIGAEAIVPVHSFSLDGHHWKRLRSTVRSLARSGHQVEELKQPIDESTMSQLRAVSDSWLDLGHRERAFTLGRFDEEYLRSSRVIVVRDADGVIDAFVNLIPSYRSTNGSFDLMRRRAGSANGVMDLLFIHLIDLFRSDGMSGMNLGLVPLALQPNESPVDRLLRALREHGDRWFHFDGLYEFKDKWNPVWEPRYLAYRSATNLPRLAHALQRAGGLCVEEAERPRRIDQIVRVAHRFPVTLGIGGLILWLMAVTTVDPRFNSVLIRLFGLSWADLTNLQLWRLVTAPIVQASPGLITANVALALTALPLAEWRFGPRRTSILFWLADSCAVLVVLVLSRVAHEFGNMTAFEHLATRDAGSSAALFGLVGALVVLVPALRLRWTLLIVMCAVHVWLFVGSRQIVDIQHLLATVVGFGAMSFRTFTTNGDPRELERAAPISEAR